MTTTSNPPGKWSDCEPRLVLLRAPRAALRRGLEFAAYSCLTTGVYHRLTLWRLQAAGLAWLLSHLANAPYWWSLLTAMMEPHRLGDAVKSAAGKMELKTALGKFIRMNKWRLILTERSPFSS